MPRTIQEVYKSLTDKIRANKPDINVSPGSVVFDAWVDGLANELVRSEIISEYTSVLQSVDAIISLENDASSVALVATAKNVSSDAILQEITAHLEGLASNNNLVRNSATYSQGFVQFTRETDIVPSDEFTIPQGTRVKTIDGIEFVTTETIVVNTNIGNLIPYNGGYAVTVPVQSVNVGLTNNVVAESIVSIVTAPGGFTGVTNKESIAGAINQESDEDLAQRIKNVMQGNNVGTRKGYENLILNMGDITDVLVVGANDDLMERDNGYGGAVDIYILEEDIKQAQIQVVSIDPSNFILIPNQPVRSIVGPVGTVETSATYPYGVVKDMSVYAGSIRATDKARVITTPTLPFTLTYTYNQNVAKVQDRLTDENLALDNDVLIKEATKKLVDLTFKLKIVAGYDFDVVSSTMKSNIMNYINSQRIGVQLEASDVLSVIINTPGYDQAIIPFDIFNTQDALDEPSPILFVNTIEINQNEYVRAGNITINRM